MRITNDNIANYFLLFFFPMAENKPQASSFPSTLSVVALPEVTKHTPPLPPPPPAALPRPAMGLFDSAQCRLLSMLTLTFSFFMVELVVGYISNSTALIADSFHMLSDVVALVIAYVSIRVSCWCCWCCHCFPG